MFSVLTMSLCVAGFFGIAISGTSEASPADNTLALQKRILELNRQVAGLRLRQVDLEAKSRQQAVLAGLTEAQLGGAKEQRTQLFFQLGAAAVKLNETDTMLRIAAAAVEHTRGEAEAARALASLVAASAADGRTPDDGLDVAALGVSICPVLGDPAFGDSWHAPRPGGRLHEGVDLFAPKGAPNVAVQPGTITQGWGHLQGRGVELHADNGHTYYYFHLSAYEGGPRRVAAGEVIGYTGSSGNARGGDTHTHFEIHPMGGEAVNPYPSVAAVC